jgi:hypothetical protein
MTALMLALAQTVPLKTPDTSSYMKMGYAAVFIILGAYTLHLWWRARRNRA